MMTVPGRPPVVSTLYYADGVGPVRQLMQAGGQELIATLTATNVKPAQTLRSAPPAARNWPPRGPLRQRACLRRLHAGKPLALRPAAFPDHSLALQVPQGWTLEGQKSQYVIVDNSQLRTHGMGMVWHTIIPTQSAMPGVINTPYQPPPQALNPVLQLGRTGTDLQVLSEGPAERISPEVAQTIQQMRAQGSHVDARLMHVRFRNIPTGATLRGLFTVQCMIGAHDHGLAGDRGRLLGPGGGI